MQIQVALPDEIARSLEAKWGDLERKLLEVLVATAYREGSISVGKVRQLLGLATKLEAEAWLADNDIYLLYTEKDLEADRDTHKKLARKGLLKA